MSPVEALQLLDQVRLKATLTGQEHEAVKQAIITLAPVVNQYVKTEDQEGPAEENSESTAGS